MVKHYNTGEGLPQTRAEIDAAPDSVLEELMGRCDVEPADPDSCLACLAYMVIQDRERRAQIQPHFPAPGENDDCRVCGNPCADHDVEVYAMAQVTVTDYVWEFGAWLVDRAVLDTAGDVLSYFEKPWKWITPEDEDWISFEKERADV